MSRTEMVVVLLYMSVVHGHKSERVWCTQTKICAVKGSTVTINCNIPEVYFSDVKEISWYTRRTHNTRDLTTDTNYAGRLKYSCEQERCTLTIRDLKLTDSAEYKFLLKYHYYSTYYYDPGVTLSVTDLAVNTMYSSRIQCDNRCKPSRPSYIWYKNGQKTSQTQALHLVHNSYVDSYSCALTGSEVFPSPSKCVSGKSCHKVIYTDRKVCAFKGSSVDISCTYNSFYDVESKFWFSPERSRRWQNPSEPEDLSKDSEYSGRVQVVETERGRSTLRITDLRETDSAEYRFKFITGWSGWGSDSPGTTLTVTDIWVEVFRYFSPPKLKCETSCHLRDGSSYVWFKNGKEIPGQSSYFYSDSLDSLDSYSCAVKGYEEFTSNAKCVSDPCNRVIYTHRRVCAFKGSSVDITGSYSSTSYIQSKFWFRPDSSPRWQNPSEPEDLSEDSQYSSRVQFLEPETGRSTLRITDLTESDSAEYRFKFKTGWYEWGSDSPGTTLTVTAVQLQVSRVIEVHQSHTEAELKCVSSCSPTGLFIFVWFKNGEEVQEESSSSYTDDFDLGDDISCALRGYEDHRSASVYAPKLPSVSVSPSAEIVEGSSVTLTCSSDANPAAELTWYKEKQSLETGSQLLFTSIQSSHSGEYYCAAQNKLGRRMSDHASIDVKYPPKSSTLSVSPSADIVEGSSVNLTCSSDANPAANYTWYKDDQTVLQGPEGVYHFSSISSEDRGTYHCRSDNQYGEINSTSLFLDVQYGPKRPSVSVSPSAVIVEGSSVNLTCSSDANPAAKLTWYKEDEDSPKASGQIFTITDLRPEHSGNYSCEAQNTRGRHKSTLTLTVVSGSVKSAAAGSITVLLLAIIFVSVVLLIRRRRSLKPPCEVGLAPNIITQTHEIPDYENSSDAVQIKAADDILYASVRFTKNPEALYSNIRTTQPNTEEKKDEDDEEQSVEYSTVNVNSVDASSRTGHQEDVEDPCALYSTVSKKYRV